MEPPAAIAPTAHVQRWAWLRVVDEVRLDDLRSRPPGDARRRAVVDRMRAATATGTTEVAAELRGALAAAGLHGARVEAIEQLWADGSAAVRIDVPSGQHDARRAVDELLAARGARALDPADLPQAAGQDVPADAPAPSGAAGLPGDPNEPRQWFAHELGFAAAHDAGLTGEDVRVAVVDSGTDTAHPELVPALGRGRVHDRFAGAALRSGHGTFVAGIVAGARTGLAPGVDLISSRTYGARFADHAGEDQASRTTQRLNAIRALQDALAPDDGSRGADLIVTSWGILDAPGIAATDYDRTMGTIAAAGAIVVAAAGNDGSCAGGGTIAVPAQLPDVLAVGGVDRRLEWHPRASTGPSPRTGLPKPDLAAPVVDIRSTALGGGRADTTDGPDGGFAGTSAAAPVAAALIALLTQAVHDRGHASPDLDEVRAVLPMLARDVGERGPDARTGLGVVEAAGVHAATDEIVAARER